MSRYTCITNADNQRKWWDRYRYEETPSNISITAEITVHVKMLARKLSSFLTNFQQASWSELWELINQAEYDHLRRLKKFVMSLLLSYSQNDAMYIEVQIDLWTKNCLNIF